MVLNKMMDIATTLDGVETENRAKHISSESKNPPDEYDVKVDACMFDFFVTLIPHELSIFLYSLLTTTTPTTSYKQTIKEYQNKRRKSREMDQVSSQHFQPDGGRQQIEDMLNNWYIG